MRRPDARPTTAWLTIALMAALILSTPPSDANACAGTPPPIQCGRSFAFATGGDFNVVPGENLNITAYGYLSEFGMCPPGTYQIIIRIDFPNQPLAKQLQFPPFDAVVGDNTYTIGFPVPPGPPRLEQMVLTATVEMTPTAKSQATVIFEQTSNETVCIQQPSPIDPTKPLVTMRPLQPIVLVHPANQTVIEIEITSNEPPVPAAEGGAKTNITAHLIAEKGIQVASTPTLVQGTNSLLEGLFGLSNQAADVFPFVPGPVPPAVCLVLPDPHSFTGEESDVQVDLMPGETKVFEYSSRVYHFCTDGSCSSHRLVLKDLAGNIIACSKVTVSADLQAPANVTDWFDAAKRAKFSRSKQAVSSTTDVGTGNFTTQFQMPTANTTISVDGVEMIPVLAGGEPQSVFGRARLSNEINLTTPVQPGSTVDIAFSVEVSGLGFTLNLDNAWPVDVPGALATQYFRSSASTDASLNATSESMYQVQVLGFGAVSGEAYRMDLFDVDANPSNNRIDAALLGSFIQFKQPEAVDEIHVYVEVRNYGSQSGISSGATPLSPGLAQLRVHPNPASSTATIRLLPTVHASLFQDATIGVYNLAGRRVHTLDVPTNGILNWGLTDERGRAISSGVYFLRLSGVETPVSEKLLILR